MVEELQVKIGADASDFVEETKRASQAFDKFTDAVEDSAEGVAKASGSARDAFGRFVKGTEKGAAKTKKATTAFEKLAAAAKRGASRVRELGNRFGKIGVRALQAGFRGLVSIVTTVTKTVIGLGVALAGIGTAAAVSFAKFQREFSQVRTLVDESKIDIQELEDGVRELSRRFGVDLTDATNAAYQAISAGQDPANVVDFLAQSFAGAAAGAASTTEAVDLFTTVLNAFGKQTSETQNVSDILFATVKAGKTTFSELAASIGQVAPVAAASGVSLEEVGAVVATLTASGLNTAEAITAFKAALVGILKPSVEAASAFEDIGVSAESLRESGFVDAIARVRQAVEEGNTSIVDFFPNVRALVGVSALAGTGFEKLGESLDLTSNAAGQSANALKKVASTTAFSFGKLRKTIEDTFRQVGKVIDPFAKRGIEAFRLFARSARSEIELVGDLLADRFAPLVEDAFGQLEESATTSSDLATTALDAIADGFEFVAKQIRSAAPVIAGIVATFETLGDVVKIVVNVIKTGLGAVLTLVSGQMTIFLKQAENLASVLGLDLADSLKEAADFAEDLTKELAGETAGAFNDVIEAGKDFADVTDVLEDTEKAVSKFGSGVGKASGAVRDFNEAVGEARIAREFEDQAKKANEAAEKLARGTAAAAEQQKQLDATAGGAADALEKLDQSAAGAGTSVDSLVQSFEKANTGAKAFDATVRTLAEGVAAIGQAQTGEQALAARQEQISKLISAADARLESAVGAARTRAQKLNEEAKANLEAAIAAERAAIESRDRPAIEAAGKDVEAAQRALEETIRRTNAAFNEQRQVAVDAFEKVREEIGKVDGALELLRENTVTKAKAAGAATIAAAKEAFEAEEQRLRAARARNQIDSEAFLKAAAANEQRLAEAIRRAGDEFVRIRAAATEAFDLSTETENVERLAAALTGEFADAVQQAKEDAETFGFTQEELNEALQRIVDMAGEAGDAFEDLGDAAEEASDGFDELGESAKDTAKDLLDTATAAEQAAARIAAAQAKIAAQARSFARTGVGVRPGGETQAEVNARFGVGRSGGFGFGIQPGRGVGRVNVGEGVFHDGGPVTQTGRAEVLADEFVLSNRGLSDLGRMFADMINRGRSESIVNQTNNFNVQSVTPDGSGEDQINELAFKLRPALDRTGRLAAAASPIT